MAGPASSEPLSLRCGLMLPNRLVKASMSENIKCSRSLPDERILNAYRHWAEGGWGLLITGNVQIDDRYLGTSTDLSVDSSLSDEAIIESWRAWASTCSKNGTPAVMQLNHPGRQCPIGAGKHGLFTKNVAPSAIGLHMGPGIIPAAVSKLAFGVPRELHVDEINMIVEKFSRAAFLASKSGFKGVEIHASHGYLVDQFLSESTNLREDAYGGSTTKRTKLATDIIHAIRDATPHGFCIGILLGAADDSPEPEKDTRLEQLSEIIAAGVDYVHISGGTFEKPAMFLGPELSKASGSTTEEMTPYFADYAAKVKAQYADLPIFTSGGFRSREHIESALSTAKCDAVGVVRPAAVRPDLPRSIILNTDVPDEKATFDSPRVEAPWLVKQVGVTALNVHMDNAWYLDHIAKMSLRKA